MHHLTSNMSDILNLIKGIEKAFIRALDVDLLLIYLQEIFSIKLPGNPKLGEGKPENQNHAIIFTRGEAVQTIDMNQVRNLSFFKQL